MSYLNSLRISFSTDGGLPHAERLPSGEEGQRQIDYLRSIEAVLNSMKIVMVFFEYALREAKIEMQNPPTTNVTLLLSRCPRQDLDYVKAGQVKVIQMDLEYDSVKLLDIPRTAGDLGEFALGCWERAIPRLEKETDFPSKFIREQMEKFRAQGYRMCNTLKPTNIAGSKAKARIHGEISCACTILKVEVAYRKTPLFERVIWETPEQAFNIAYSKRDCVVEDGQFKVRGARQIGDQFLLPEAAFPIGKLPEEFVKTLT